jgi:ABC-2 type transport system permease protein
VTSNNTTLHLTVRNLRVAVRNPLAIMFTLFQPVLWMALFSQSFKRLADFPGFSDLGYTSYIAFFVPSVLALTVLNASVRSGVAMITDINTGVLDKFLISPIGRASIMLGRILADAIGMAAQCLIVLALAFAMGAKAQTGFGGVLVVLVLTVWLGVCAAAFSDFIALRTRNAQLTMIVGGTASLPLLFLSSAFFPEQLQPDWLNAVGKLNPVAYVVSSGQNLLNLGVHWGQLLSTVGVLGLTAALCFTGAVRAFRFATSGAGGRPGRNRKATTVRDTAPETKPEVAAR